MFEFKMDVDKFIWWSYRDEYWLKFNKDQSLMIKILTGLVCQFKIYIGSSWINWLGITQSRI